MRTYKHRFNYNTKEDIELNLINEGIVYYQDHWGDMVPIDKNLNINPNDIIFTITKDFCDNLISISSNIGGPLLFEGEVLIENNIRLFEGSQNYKIFPVDTFLHRIRLFEINENLLFTRTIVYNNKFIVTNEAETNILED